VEAQVRWLFSRIEGNEPALIFQGRKFANCVVMDYPIRVYTTDIKEVAALRPVEKKGKPQSPLSIAKYFLSEKGSHGMTKGAERLLQSVVEAKPLDEDEIDVLPSENDLGTPPPVPKAKHPKTVKDEINEKNHPTPKPTRLAKVKKVKPPSETEVELEAETAARGEPKAKAERPGLLAPICKELGIEPKDARKKLRAAGMNAPYDDEAKIRAALAPKEKKK
jgi:hypothetical protein